MDSTLDSPQQSFYFYSSFLASFWSLNFPINFVENLKLEGCNQAKRRRKKNGTIQIPEQSRVRMRNKNMKIKQRTSGKKCTSLNSR
ncbi:hypothetical protein BLOT_013917, partial [Blomia tropicalis]